MDPEEQDRRDDEFMGPVLVAAGAGFLLGFILQLAEPSFLGPDIVQLMREQPLLIPVVSTIVAGCLGALRKNS